MTTDNTRPRFLVDVDLGYPPGAAFDREHINHIGEALAEAISKISFTVGFTTVAVEGAIWRPITDPMPTDLAREALAHAGDDLVPAEDEDEDEEDR